MNSFDSEGSFGPATTLQTSALTLTPATAPRFTSTTEVPQSLLPPPPAIGFPAIPVRSGPTADAIYWSQDSAVSTPYAHVLDFSIARELRNGSSFELSYVGRMAHHLLEQEDVAMPTNLSAAGTSYFAAARQMARLTRANGGAGVPVSSVQPIPYRQTLFGALDGQDIGFGPGFTATQNIYQLYQQNIFNEANALYALDMPDSNTGAGINPNGLYPSNRFYHDQFSALYAWRSIGNSNYNALQAVYRQRFSLGLQADFNYTFSKSLDATSQAERLGTSGSINYAQIINTWNPSQLYGPSDFDLRHQMNANYIWDLPFGRGKRFASSVSRLADELIGGWQTTGVIRWTSGFPYSVNNGGNFPTNYDIQGFATQIGSIPHGRGKLQQMFTDPAAAFAAFDLCLPGDSGSRNILRGDGYFEQDAGLAKTFPINEGFHAKAGMELFNVTNSVRFDAHRFRPTSRTPMALEMQLIRLRIPVWLSFTAALSSNARSLVAFALVLCAFPVLGWAQSAATPPMGWNSWNHFGREVSDADVRAAADAVVSSGMKDAGYVYVNIDDGWQGTRDAQGNIRANSKFPDMKALAGYVHARGLKLGIYSSPGTRTCANFEGSYGHEEQDARTYADWGIDYLKYDLCSFRINLAEDAPGLSTEQKDAVRRAANDPRAQYALLSRFLKVYSPEQIAMMKAAYQKMHLALQKTGRPIFYSLCQYGIADVWEWGASVGGNSWRTTGDIRDSYTSMSDIGFGQLGIAQFAGPGHWNDPDMLEIGNGGMTADEYRTHISLWALLAAPLLAGNDLSKMPPEILSILTNRDVIAVDQDPLGKQGERIAASNATEIWMKALKGGAIAVGLFNRGGKENSVTLRLADAGLDSPAKARDLWAGRDLGALRGSYTATVSRHGVVMLKLQP